MKTLCMGCSLSHSCVANVTVTRYLTCSLKKKKIIGQIFISLVLVKKRRADIEDGIDWISMSSDFQHYSFRMPNIGFQNLPLNIYIVVFGTAIFVFILSLLFCCYLIRLRHQAHKELYAYKQVIQKEKVKELNLHEVST
ncbi:unnamed protein product [Oncorhynchus mykiss]|uniref:Uncharacterized protein n=1 Tax=Oncorhynchus mykiss TaxID=8022 RepID=A0A060WYJ4_ONCMY|nr:unnamed protein product [Oncorhynchus mykiss]